MCIRDRFKTSLANLVAWSEGDGAKTSLSVRRFATALIANSTGEFPWPCLLYTSDAADERSSVDLGGRRIIKKKNKLEHHARSISETTETNEK